MKLKFDFETMQIDDETVAVPVGDGAEEFHGVLKLNDSAAFILDVLKEDVTEQQIVDKVLQNFDGDEEQIKYFVNNYVATLKSENLLV